MRKIIVASMLALVLLITLVPFSNAEMAKEGKVSCTNIYTATSKAVALDKEHYAVTYEAIGVNINDTGEGPFHNMSTQNIGVIYFDKGVGKTLGYVVMTAPDGDKIFVEIRENKALLPPNPSIGTGKFIGGTGKFAGIEGTVEYKRYYVRPAKRGIDQAIAHIKAVWKLPETQK